LAKGLDELALFGSFVVVKELAAIAAVFLADNVGHLRLGAMDMARTVPGKHLHSMASAVVRMGSGFRIAVTIAVFHRLTVPDVGTPTADETAYTGLGILIVSMTDPTATFARRPGRLRWSEEGTWILFAVFFAIVEAARIGHLAFALFGGVAGLADGCRPKTIHRMGHRRDANAVTGTTDT